MILASHRTAFGVLVLAASGCAVTATASEGAPEGTSPQFSPETGCCDALAVSLAGTYGELVAYAGAETPGDAPSGFAGVPADATPLGKFVVTWYSFQTNTPVNSAIGASGRALIPYVSVAVPFRLLSHFGGSLSYGEHLHLGYLDGRRMPNGLRHTGWVRIDDFCGDGGNDAQCFQTIGGASYPNTDLFVGDFTASGIDPRTCDGPAGDGQQLTDVFAGDPGTDWVADYGGRSLGSGRCGDVGTAKPQQGACWSHASITSSSTDCSSCKSATCSSW